RDATVTGVQTCALPILDKVEKLTAEELKKFEDTTAVALARRNLDLAALNRRTQLHEDLRLMPEYVQDLFLIAARTTGLNVEEREIGRASCRERGWVGGG